MRVLLVGFGYYVLGNEKCEGGTVFPALCRWALLEHKDKNSIVLVVRDKEAKTRAVARTNLFLGRVAKGIQLPVKVITFKELVPGDRFDAAIISIPEVNHYECIDALKCHTSQFLCVKPVGESLEVFNKIEELARNNNLNIFVDFHKRFDQSNMLLVSEVVRVNASKMWYTFFYGQKAEMPRVYFRRWAEFSNPYQYLAPHFLDLIFKSVSRDEAPFRLDKVSGSVRALSFDHNPRLIDLVDVNLSLLGSGKEIILNSCCNWAEPKYFPHKSRQRIEYQSDGFHFISEQDDRGQRFSYEDSYIMPNPHFMAPDDVLVSDGYGIASFMNFLSYVKGRFPARRLARLEEYKPVAQVIDFVNKTLVA